MYAYCNNNPIAYVDYSGELLSIPIALTGLLATAVILLCVSSLAYISNASNQPHEGSITDVEMFAPESSNGNANNYIVYQLIDGETGKVEYVGRTQNIDAREKAHKANPFRGHLKMNIIHSNLTWEEARGLEQHYMMLYHTLNSANKMNNQINGISPKNKNIQVYNDAALRYLENLINDSILNVLGV